MIGLVDAAIRVFDIMTMPHTRRYIRNLCMHILCQKRLQGEPGYDGSAYGRFVRFRNSDCSISDVFMKIRILILLFSVALAALILWVGQTLINQLSSKQKNIQQEILRREDAILKKIQVKLLETGYRQPEASLGN